jgi:hypothetical protein
MLHILGGTIELVRRLISMDRNAYLSKAEECFRAALTTKDARQRQDWLRATVAWRELADVTRDVAEWESRLSRGQGVGNGGR